MMLFEEQPWLLIPLVIVTVEAWNAAKAAIRSAVASRRARHDRVA
jgi:hypothetical protein